MSQKSIFVARKSSLKVRHFSGHLDVLREEFDIKVQENGILRRERDELRLKVDLQAKELETLRKKNLCPVCRSGARLEAAPLLAVSNKSISLKSTAMRRPSLALAVPATQLRTAISPSGSSPTHVHSEGALYSPSQTGNMRHQTLRLRGSPPTSHFTSRRDVSHLTRTEEPISFGKSGGTLMLKTPASPAAAVSSPPFNPTPNLTKRGSEHDWLVKFRDEGRTKLKVQVMFQLLLPGLVRSVKFSGDGRYLATGTAKNVHIFDLKQGSPIRVLTDLTSADDSITRDVYFSPDDTYLAAASSDSKIRIWDIEKKRIRNVFTGHRGPVFAIAFSPKGRLIASASRDNTVRVWNMRSGSMAVLNHDDPDSLHLTHDFNAVVWSPDGRYVVGAHDDGTVRIWDVRSLHSGWVRKVMAHADWIGCLAITRDGKGLVSGCEAGILKYWDLDWSRVRRGGWKGSSARVKRTEGNLGRTAKLSTPLHEFSGHKAYIYSIAISPDGRWIVSGSFDQSVCIWDVRNAVLHCTLLGHRDPVTTVDFSPTGGHIACGDLGGTVMIWKCETQ